MGSFRKAAPGRAVLRRTIGKLRQPNRRHETGRRVFARACAACHGDQGQGIQKDGETVRTIHEPAFLALISDQVLRRYAITGRPDLGMPNYAQAHDGESNFVPLTDQEVADLVALLASWRRE